MSPLFSSPFPSFTDEETDPREWSNHPEVTQPEPGRDLSLLTLILVPMVPPLRTAPPGTEAQGAATLDKKASLGYKNSEANAVTYPTLETDSPDGWILNLIWIWGGDRRAIS